MGSVYEGFDVEWYREKLDKAIYRYGLPRGAPTHWLRNLDRDVSDLLGYMQPLAPLYWQFYLYEALTAGGIIDRKDVHTITILDQRWHCGEYLWNFAPRKIEHQVRRALKGLNYLVLIEFEVFGNRRYQEEWMDESSHRVVHDRGRVIAPHIQGLIWGRRPSRHQRAQFLGGFDNAPGIVLKQLTNLAGAVRYMVKPPYMGQLFDCYRTASVSAIPGPTCH